MISIGMEQGDSAMKLLDPNRSQWYRQSFGELYPIIYAHRSLEAAKTEIAGLATWAPLHAHNTVLDVCCGNGRHLAAIRQLGCMGFGFDLSAELVEQAATRPELRHRIFRGNILKIPLDMTFDRVVNLFTSFGYFQEHDQNKHAFFEMAKRVEPGGVLILDHMNARRIRETLVPRSEETKAGYRIIQERALFRNRVQKRIEVTEVDGTAKWEFIEDVRLFDPVEMITLAREAGFSEVTLHGSFQGEPFSTNSQRMILRAKRDG